MWDPSNTLYSAEMSLNVGWPHVRYCRRRHGNGLPGRRSQVPHVYTYPESASPGYVVHIATKSTLRAARLRTSGGGITSTAWSYGVGGGNEGVKCSVLEQTTAWRASVRSSNTPRIVTFTLQWR